MNLPKFEADFDFSDDFGHNTLNGTVANNPGSPKKVGKLTPREKVKVSKVMKEGYAGTLHSGSKTGPVVKNPKQMAAIAYSRVRKNRARKKS
jgi:hypothetical protein